MPESVVPQLDLATTENGERNPPLQHLEPAANKDSTATVPTMNGSESLPDSPKPSRDSTWLQIEVCRDFQRDTCPRGYQCRFAHPESKVVGIVDGKVTCCFDFLKVCMICYILHKCDNGIFFPNRIGVAVSIASTFIHHCTSRTDLSVLENSLGQ